MMAGMKTQYTKIVGAFRANPGAVTVAMVPDGLVHNWAGGRIALCDDDKRARQVLTRGPWHLDWLCRDIDSGIWYVRRGALKNPWYEG